MNQKIEREVSKGVVTKSMGLWYEVAVGVGEFWTCRLKGKFRIEDKKISNPVAVGDVVMIQNDPGDLEHKIIYEILPRDNYIIRKSPKKKGHSHIIASNVDQAALVVTLSSPRTSLGFIDRFLVTAEAFRIPALIIFNKRDLMDAPALQQANDLRNEYEGIGYSSVLISALDTGDVDGLLNKLADKTTLLAGHSGAGKSTLINQLIPNAQQTTSEISTFADKGVHTTTFAERFSIDATSHVIDTPGIKELGLAEVEDNELSHYFPELRGLLGNCKFHNCSHTHEPGCAIEEAYKEGSITAARYDSYLGILSEEDNRR